MESPNLRLDSTLLSLPKSLVAGALALVIVAQAFYKKQKWVSKGRAPMVSYLIPWVGSALDIARDPDAFFDRARWVSIIMPEYVAAWLTHS